MCTFRADFVLKAFLQVLHLNDFLRVLFSAAMSNILKARKRKVLVEFLPATFFVWVLCTGWLFGLSYQMPNFSKLESQLYEYLTMRAKKKKLLIVSNKYSFPIISSSINLSWLIFNWNLCVGFLYRLVVWVTWQNAEFFEAGESTKCVFD